MNQTQTVVGKPSPLSQVSKLTSHFLNERKPLSLKLGRQVIPTIMLQWLEHLSKEVRLTLDEDWHVVEHYMMYSMAAPMPLSSQISHVEEFMLKQNEHLSFKELNRKSFALSSLYEHTNYGLIRWLVDVMKSTGEIESRAVNLVMVGSEVKAVSLTPIEKLQEFSRVDMSNLDKEKHRLNMVFSLTQALTTMKERKTALVDENLCKPRFDVGAIIRDILYDNTLEVCDYNDNTCAIRKFDISIPKFTCDKVNEGFPEFEFPNNESVIGRVYLNRASSFGTLTFTIDDNTDVSIDTNSLLSWAVTRAFCAVDQGKVNYAVDNVSYMASKRNHKTYISRGVMAHSIGKRADIITVTFPIDGWVVK